MEVKQIQFWLCVLAYCCLRGSMLPYLAETLRWASDVDSLCHLHSGSTSTLPILSTHQMTLGDRLIECFYWLWREPGTHWWHWSEYCRCIWYFRVNWIRFCLVHLSMTDVLYYLCADMWQWAYLLPLQHFSVTLSLYIGCSDVRVICGHITISVVSNSNHTVWS